MIDFAPPSSILHDETSNQSIEIPDPPMLAATQIVAEINHRSDDDDEAAAAAIPMNLSFHWLDEQMRAGVDLRPLLARILPGLPSDVSQGALFQILMDFFLPVRQRQPLEQYQTLDHAVNLIRQCKNILVLTGAGISVSCGSKSLVVRFSMQPTVYGRSSSGFSFSQRHLRPATRRISRTAESTVDVRHRLFYPRSSSVLSFRQRDLAGPIPAFARSLLHR